MSVSHPSGPELGYRFQDQSLYQLALTHRSAAAANNERLEFLGDAILNFVIAEALYRRFPAAREGQLSRARASLVRGGTLAEVARGLNFGPALILGQGESRDGGAHRDSILADALEAVIGAIYLDGGADACQARILHWFGQRLADVRPDELSKDAKTRLQEWLQARQQPLPRYQTEAVDGEGHRQSFRVACHVVLLPGPCYGAGRSRRIAEQRAADTALQQLESGSRSRV